MSGPRRVAIVTGAGSGVGRSVTVELAAAGWDAVLVGRREDKLRETAELCARDATCEILALDITRHESSSEIVTSAIAAFGRADAIVNNAGYTENVPIERSDPELIDASFRLNALAPAYLIHGLWPVFQRRRAGRIVNVSTMGSKDPLPGLFAYAAAKSASESLVRSCAREGIAYEIKAFAVAPGAIDTALLRRVFSEAEIADMHCLTPGEVGHVIVECLEGVHDAHNGCTLYLTGDGMEIE